MPFYSQWQHVFKLDPEKTITDEQLERLCMSGTDAIIVGGSSGVTFENTVDLMARIRRYSLDCALEVSTLEGAVPGFDGYFVPFVLNTEQIDWLMLKQLEGLKQYGSFVPWESTAASGYIILNDECTAAKVSGANANLTSEDIEAYIWLADRLWHLPVIYLEYSGIFGDMELLRLAAVQTDHAQLFYGGGITCAEQAEQVARFAHTTVVGNIIYSDMERAIETVQAVKRVRAEIQ